MKSDQLLQQQVLAALDFDPAVTSEHIGVSVDEGVVKLSGSVTNYMEKNEAHKCASHIGGVKGVENEISIKILGLDVRTDNSIADAVQHVLDWSIFVPSEVRASVESGVVTLIGDVHWQFQKKSAEKAVRNIRGVVAIKNLITVKPQADTKDIEQRIREALRRSADQDARKIEVEVDDRKVTLRGKVHSKSALKEAEWAAWSAPGVGTVENLVKRDSHP